MPTPPSPSRPDVEALLAHTPYVRALARELVFDAALARDVEQETWLAALEQAPRDPTAQRGWLAAIVRNLARKAWRSSARRRTREEQHASELPAVPTPAEVAEREDLRRRLVEKVNALEEPYRAALVLRYLEGLEPPAIARRLAVPLETVRTRLKRGLELLRARLDRDNRAGRGGGREAWCLALVRGFELGPPSLVQLASVALSASLTGTSGILVMSIAKKTALAAIVLALGGALYLVSELGEPAGVAQRGEEAALATATLASAAEASPSISAPVVLAAERVGVDAPAALSADDGDTVRVSGRVLGPDGKPQADAEVCLSRWYWHQRSPRDPIAVTRTDAQGHWSLSYSRSDPRFAVDVERPEMWRHVFVSAFAPGFGPGWQALAQVPAGEEVVLSLVHDASLKGRLLDLEGRPVAGVTVSVLSVQEPESLDGFLEDPSSAVKKSKYLQLPPPHELVATTGLDGRFELAGIGGERIVRLDLRGPTITHAYLEAATRTMEPVVRGEAGYSAAMGSTRDVLFGNGFDWIVRPTRPITGIVRAADTGQPMADVGVRSMVMSGVPFVNDAVETRTDANGRFRLLGMPKGADNQLLVVPNDEQPYFLREVPVPDPAGMAAVEVEVELRRGSFVTGRVIERGTGKPVHGRVHYLPFLDNLHAQKLFDGDSNVPGAFADQRRYRTDAQGNFRIVVAPGRAILGVSATGSYRQGAGSESIEGMDEEGNFATFSSPVEASRRWPTAMREIDPPEGGQTIPCDIEVDAGEVLELELVDSAGQPVEHCRVDGSAGGSYGDALDAGPAVTIKNLGPKERRLLRIHQPERELALAAFVSLEDGVVGAAAGKRVLSLAPCTTIVGRLLDQGGAPVGDVEIVLQTGIDFDRLPSVQTDAEGRFRVEHVASGVPFTLGAWSAVLEDSAHVIERDFVVEPGATMDLGDVRVKVR